MTHLAIIPGFSDYAIEPDGTVWRITPTQCDVRWGPVPRRMSVVMVGAAGRRCPAVTVTPSGSSATPTKKTVLSLLKLAYPEAHQ